MVDLNVVLVPVAVREQNEDGLPVMIGYAPRRRVAVAAGAVESGADGGISWSRWGSPFTRLAHRLQSTPRPVSFRDETAGGGREPCLYDAASLGIDRGWPADAQAWRPLLSPRASASDAQQVGRDMLSGLDYSHDVIDYWRQQLEERNCAWLPAPLLHRPSVARCVQRGLGL